MFSRNPIALDLLGYQSPMEDKSQLSQIPPNPSLLEGGTNLRPLTSLTMKMKKWGTSLQVNFNHLTVEIENRIFEEFMSRDISRLNHNFAYYCKIKNQFVQVCSDMRFLNLPVLSTLIHLENFLLDFISLHLINNLIFNYLFRRPVHNPERRENRCSTLHLF